jgi:tRNA (guanine10-N2)-dimethyltransferase
MSRSLVLLSGEGSTIPAAEAKALFLAYDPSSRFQSPEKRILIAESGADPALVARRIAFARRVGVLVDDVTSIAETVKRKRIRVRSFTLKGDGPSSEGYDLLDGLDVRIDLDNPDLELTLVRGAQRYVVLTNPSAMKQAWSLRRPRRRAFFHPAAIFPKLSRALVNLTRCREGDLLLDPFCGTGSIPIEAAAVGIEVAAADRSAEMARGALANMKLFGQSWLSVIRADAFRLPLKEVDGVATDVPYGRAASTQGRATEEVISMSTELLPSVMKNDSIMVLVHPENRPVESNSKLSVLDEHRLYVHKRLTRAITILRKK